MTLQEERYAHSQVR